METELSLLSPPATPPLELHKVSQLWMFSLLKLDYKTIMHILYDKGHSLLSVQWMQYSEFAFKLNSRMTWIPSEKKTAKILFQNQIPYQGLKSIVLWLTLVY